MSFLSVIWWIVQLIFWAIVCPLFAIWWAQGYIIYLPTVGGRSGIRRKLAFNTYTSRSPAEQQLPYDEYFLTTTDNVMLHTWFLPHQTKRSTVPTLIFFHGNAGNIGNRIYNAQQLMMDCEVNIFLVEYRGYGNSTGTPSEHGFHLDALCALDFLRTRHDLINTTKIFIFGRSLGGAVATWLLSQRPQHIAGLILENTFTSLEDMAISMGKNVQLFTNVFENATFVKCLRYFLYMFMTSHWRTIDLCPTLQRPTLLLSGGSDELIPQQQMVELYNQLPNDIYVHMHKIDSGTHNDTYIRGGDEYYQVIKKFINNVVNANDMTPPPQKIITQQH